MLIFSLLYCVCMFVEIFENQFQEKVNNLNLNIRHPNVVHDQCFSSENKQIAQIK